MRQSDHPFNGIENKNRYAVSGAYGNGKPWLCGHKGIRIRTRTAIRWPALCHHHSIFMNLLAPKNLGDINTCLHFKIGLLRRVNGALKSDGVKSMETSLVKAKTRG